MNQLTVRLSRAYSNSWEKDILCTEIKKSIEAILPGIFEMPAPENTPEGEAADVYAHWQQKVISPASDTLTSRVRMVNRPTVPSTSRCNTA